MYHIINIRLYLLSSLYAAVIIASNIAEGKLITLAGYTITTGLVIFPVTYILNDILAEVYGFARATMVMLNGYASQLVVVMIFMITVALPYPDFWHNQSAYETVLGITPRILFASLIAAMAGSISNAYALVQIKRITNNRRLWVRTIGSTVIGEGIDSVLFILITFVGVLPDMEVINLMVANWIGKTLIEVLFTPVTYFVIHHFKRWEGLTA